MKKIVYKIKKYTSLLWFLGFVCAITLQFFNANPYSAITAIILGLCVAVAAFVDVSVYIYSAKKGSQRKLRKNIVVQRLFIIVLGVIAFSSATDNIERSLAIICVFTLLVIDTNIHNILKKLYE